MTGKQPIRFVRWTLALGTSVAAMSVAAITPAWAQCTPDPTVANGTTTCSGTDSDGVGVTTPGTTLSITQGTLVTATTTPAVTVDVPITDFDGATETIAVSGKIDGIGQAGIAVYTSSLQPPVSFAINHTMLNVATGATVTGDTALALLQGQGSDGYVALASIDNSGILSGTSGIALSASADAGTGFESITNRQGGTIGAIVGQVGTLANAGLIDGGARSAIDTTADRNIGIDEGGWSNSGTIRSASVAATMLNIGQLQPLANSGTISNNAAGAAIAGDNLTITNLAGGTISTAGATAISTTVELNLANSGTIVGNVVASRRQGYGGFDTIDSSSGTIEGNVSLGDGNDILVARYDGTPTLVTGITGTIDAGGGTNTVELAPTQDLTIATPITLLAGFQQLGLAAAKGTTITLATGFVAPSTILLSGDGTVVNQADIVMNGPAFEGTGGGFTNAGSIKASVSQYDYGLYGGTGTFTNTGTIDITGNGLVGSGGGTITNTGTIIATGTAVSLSGASINNKGLIRSTGGTALDSTEGGNGPDTNSGRIEGADYGVIGGITNSGTITATGTAIGLETGGALNNLAGGVVSGGKFAVTGHNPYGTTSVNDAVVFNAGMINGDVVFPGNGTSFYPSGNVFVALPGGVLSGNLTLGNTDTLVTDLVNTGSSAFAGITGTVTSNGGLLRYRVSADASATLGPVGPFATAGYQLTDGASLHLSASPPQTQTLILAGDGTVDLTADIAATNADALMVAAAVTEPSATTTTTSPGLTITSHGTLSAIRDDYNSQGYGVVQLGIHDTLINDGTIIAVPSTQSDGIPDPAVYEGAYPFMNSATLINNGTIQLNGTIGVVNVATVINNGSIVQIGSTSAQGIDDAETIDNRGTIDVDGTAISALFADGASLTNSGRITSRSGVSVAFGSVQATVSNLAGGTITAGPGQDAISIFTGSVVNAGTINGNVDFGSGYGDGGSTYVAAGGTLNGNLLFSGSDDVFVSLDGGPNVNGTINAGDGVDSYVQGRSHSGTVQLSAALPATFEVAGAEALGTNTVVTVTGAVPTGSTGLAFYGDGAIVNQVDVPTGTSGATPNTVQLSGIAGADDDGSGLAFTNSANLGNGVSGTARTFTNTGAITGDHPVDLSYASTLFSFDNSGTITKDPAADGTTSGFAVEVIEEGGSSPIASASITNSGTIDGGLAAFVATPSFEFSNSGTIRSSGDAVAVGSLIAGGTPPVTMSLMMANSGNLQSTGQGAIALSGSLEFDADPGTTVTPPTETITSSNSGSIVVSGNGGPQTITKSDGTTETDFTPSAAVLLSGDAGAHLSLTNAAGGTIAATGTGATAVIASTQGGTFTLVNAGTITGGAGTTPPSTAQNVTLGGVTLPSGPLAGAIEVIGATSTITNSGTITGSILLGDGQDSITNSGILAGNINMGGGDDRFTELAGGSVTGTVDGGGGINALSVDTSGNSGGAFDTSRFTNFQSIAFTGTGAVTLAGSLAVPTVQLAGGTIDIAAGTTLQTTSGTTIIGSDGADNVVNNGHIAGSVPLGGGDDNFTEGAGSSVGGVVDGGTGYNTYHVVLAGDRSGIGARSNFQALSVEGSGTLGLTLDQDFSTVLLAGTGLDLALAGHNVGNIVGGDGADSLTLDGDVAQVSLGGGTDVLTPSGTSIAGHYDGGAGTDSAHFTATAPTTLSGSVTGFETISFATSALTLSGTLGDADSTIAFDDSGHQLVVTSAGVLSGAVSLGNGSNLFKLAAGGILNGTVTGGTGFDEADLDLAGDKTLAGTTLQGFELLTTTGTGNLIIGSGTAAFGRMSLSGGLTVAAGAALTSGQVQLGAGDDDFTISGGFGGSADGGGGHNRLLVSGGSGATPVAYGQIANFDTLAQSGGFVTLAGTAQVGNVAMTGGSFVGLAGSTLVAPQISVGASATFGSAGTVVGNITVAGTLSEGTSPGTMTVQGNVALETGSHAIIAVSTGTSDLLHTTGTLTIASGATLDLTGTRPLTPGAALDLVIADGGITGDFATINQPSTVSGFIRQTADSIELFGQFANTGFRPQVAATIDYVNGLLTSGHASPALLAAVPALVGTSGATNGAAFVRLNPEPYASAMQIGFENGLSLAKAARSGVAITSTETPALFAFAQGLGAWRTLDGDGAVGTSRTKLQSHGALGGIGYGSSRISLAAFVGDLDDHATIGALGARADTEDTVAGLIGHLGLGRFSASALLAYDGGNADMHRPVAGGAAAGSRFRLRSWVSDLQIDYAFRLGKGWALKPEGGFTYIAEHRGAANESGSAAFDLDVAAGNRDFAFVDGALALEGGIDPGARIHPWISGGVRRQVSGDGMAATASFAGASTSFTVSGVGRSRTLANASAGLNVDLSLNVVLFASYSGEFGRNGDGGSLNGGLKMHF